MTALSALAGIRIIFSQHAPVPKLLHYLCKGPYYQRRLKRIKRDPNNWSKPEFLIVGDMVLIHPSLSQVFEDVIKRL